MAVYEYGKREKKHVGAGNRNPSFTGAAARDLQDCLDSEIRNRFARDSGFSARSDRAE